MSGSSQRFPERLRAGGGTELEQRLLQSAAREQPSRSLSERMAAGIGVAAPVLLAAPKSVRPPAPSRLAVTARAALPWLAWAAVAAAAGGAVVILRSKPSPGPQVHTAAPPQPAPPDPPQAAPPPAAKPDVAAVAPEDAAPSTGTVAPRSSARPAASTSAADLRDQITLIDSARAAVARGSAERALAILREYRSKYGDGSFRPEANALKIEALVALGRGAEARTLAERFVTEYRGSRLAARVSRLVELEPR